MIRLVAAREIRERTRTRTFRITTVALLVASLAGVVIPALLSGGGPSRRTVALAGPPDVGTQMRAAARAQGTTLSLRPATPAEAERAGARGAVDAGVIVPAGGGPVRVVVKKELPAELRAAIVQGVAAARIVAALRAAGVSPARIAAVARAPALDVRIGGPDRVSAAAAGVGVAVAIVLYLSLLLSGTVIATGVAEEKMTRVSEVLLASLRPSELLLGKVAGIGTTMLAQLLVAAVPALIAALVLDEARLPHATAAAVAWALVWFVAGYLLYSAIYGALGSLVGRQQEVGQVTALPAILLLAGYVMSTAVASDPGAGWVAVLSVLPPFAPMMMPVRVAVGGVPAAQMALALVLTVGAGAGTIWTGARVYTGGITRTGSRIGLREALRARETAPGRSLSRGRTS